MYYDNSNNSEERKNDHNHDDTAVNNTHHYDDQQMQYNMQQHYDVHPAQYEVQPPMHTAPYDAASMYNYQPVQYDAQQTPTHNAYPASYEAQQPAQYSMYQQQYDMQQQPEPPQYTYPPGINNAQQYMHTQPGVYPAPVNPAPRTRNKRLGGFVRAMCLILVCSLFSAAAAYAVMDFRFSRGDFNVNRVVLGGNLSEAQPENESTAGTADTTDPVTTLTGNITAQDIYDMALKQVVGIVTEAPGMFGLPSDSSSPISGSGFVISTDGYILTNYHVIEIAHRNNFPLSVILNDGSSYDAEIIGFEESNDVALIKIDAPGLTPALIGNSDNIRVGQTVYAVGNPFGDLVYTMTDGIISALDRVVSVEGKSINAFQFSAAVNRGNSGGPIYDINGEVLGIVTAKVVRGNVEGIGFAIPINDAIEIASALIEHGYISDRPLLGITAQTVSPANAEHYDMVVGTFVRSVNPGSAAEKAGILVGDVITGLDGVEITSMEDLRFALRNHKARETTNITVWRDGEHIDLTITFDEDMHAGRPQIRQLPEPQTPDPFGNTP